MTEAEEPAVSGEAAQRIALDVGNGVPVAESQLHYGPAELAMRKRVEAWYADLRERDPHAAMDVKD